MKILHVTTIGEKEVFKGEPCESDGGGGLGTCVFLFTRDPEFLRSHELHFTAVADGLFHKKATDVGIPCHILRCNWVTVLGRPVYLRFDRNQIIALIRAEKYDVIHAHNFLAALAVGKAARKFGIPVVCTVHQDISEYLSQSANPFVRCCSHLRSELVMRIYKCSMHYCQIFVAVSDSVKKSMIRNGFKTEQIKVIRNCINIDETLDVGPRCVLADKYGLRSKTVIGTAIRLHSSKSVHLLLEAFSILYAEYPDAFLLIFGDGPERSALEKRAQDIGITDRCAFAGFLTPISDYLPLLDIYVLPSAAEGLPMAMLEAMCLGIPVVVADVGGVAEVVHDMENGILVPGGSEEAIASGVRKLLIDGALRARIGAQGKQDVRCHYSLDRYLNTYNRVYLDALQDD